MDEILCSRCGHRWSRALLKKEMQGFHFRRAPGGTTIQIISCPAAQCGRAGLFGEVPAFERLQRQGKNPALFFMIPPPGADIEYKRSL